MQDDNANNMLCVQAGSKNASRGTRGCVGVPSCVPTCSSFELSRLESLKFRNRRSPGSSVLHVIFASLRVLPVPGIRVLF